MAFTTISVKIRYIIKKCLHEKDDKCNGFFPVFVIKRVGCMTEIFSVGLDILI